MSGNISRALPGTRKTDNQFDSTEGRISGYGEPYPDTEPQRLRLCPALWVQEAWGDPWGAALAGGTM